MLLLVQLLLNLLVKVENRQAKIVPQLWITSQSVRGFLKVAEGLQVLAILVEAQPKVVQNLSRALRIKRAEVLMRRLLRSVC